MLQDEDAVAAHAEDEEVDDDVVDVDDDDVVVEDEDDEDDVEANGYGGPPSAGDAPCATLATEMSANHTLWSTGVAQSAVLPPKNV